MCARAAKVLALAVVAVLWIFGTANYGLAEFDNSCTLTLNSGQSIQSTIDSVSPNTVICLDAGIWRENLNITQALTLRGAGPDATILDGNDLSLFSSGITIRSGPQDIVTIGGLTVRHFIGGSGLSVNASAILILTDTTIADNARGILAGDSTRLTLENIRIVANRAQGLKVSDSAVVILTDSIISENNKCCELAGVEVSGSAIVALVNSIVSSNQHDGLRVTESAKLTLINCTVSDNEKCAYTAGLFVTDSAQANIQGSQLSRNGSEGLSVNGSAQVIVQDSEICDNLQGGLSVGGSAQVTLRNCQVAGNKRALDDGDGLSLWGSAQVHILSDSIRDNEGHGIQAANLSNVVECQGNEVISNGRGNYEPPELAQRCH